MILCFSGTGNTRRIADMLAAALGDEIVRLAPGMMNNPERVSLDVPDGRVIWMMPVHCWNLPRTVRKVMKRIAFASDGPVKHHLVATCGDDIGQADLEWRKLARRRGWDAGCAFSVQMPNTYTFLPGFDVDPKELEQAKLEHSKEAVKPIIAALESGEQVVDVARGKWAWYKTHVVYPLFKMARWSTKPFYADDNCHGCRRCALNCPLTNIEIVDGKPRWGGKCTMCLRCYHCCPRHAVQYGNATKGKGQYLCPGYVLKS